MSQIELIAEKREVTAKGDTRRLRVAGFVPGIVYHKGQPSLPIKLADRQLWTALHTDAGRNVLIDLKIKNDTSKKKRMVLVKDLQHNPVTDRVTHVDFHEISLTEKLTINVPIVEKGEAVGVKSEGGVLEVILRELHVECLPTDIPEHIEIDVTNLKLNQSIHVRDLHLPGNLTIKNDPDMVIVQVKLPVVEEVPAPGTETEATEPEVIGAKKEEGEEGEAAEGKEGAAPKAAAADKDKAAKPEKK